MALDYPTTYETSEGPLDVSKAAGSTSDPLELGGYDGKEPLDSTPEADEESDVLHKKNPLGYTITQPTEDEIEELDGVRGKPKSPA